jgi:multidrug resistance protein, MATE family
MRFPLPRRLILPVALAVPWRTAVADVASASGLHRIPAPAYSLPVRVDVPPAPRAAPTQPAVAEAPAQTIPGTASMRVVRRRIWALALPAIGEQVLAMGVGVSDTFLAGHLTPAAAASLGYGQATAVAAVGVATIATWVSITTFFAINIGVTALVARATGAGDRRLAQRSAAQGVALGFLAGLVMVLLAVPLADFITGAMGVSGQVATLVAQYIRVFSFAFPFVGAASAATAAMRGSSDARRPLIVMLIVNGVNILASWTLLNGMPAWGIPAFGVVGSAIGAAIGWTLGAGLALVFLLRAHPKAPTIRLPELRPQLETARRILRVGLPSAAELLVLQLGVIFFGRYVVALGSVPYAAYATINTVESIGTLPGFGFAVATTALVGQALGASDPKLAERTVYAALRPCLMVMTVIGLVALLFPHALFGLFVADHAVAAAGELAMRVSILTLTASSFAFIFNGALRGAGDTKFPVLVRAAGTWGLRIPLAILLIPLLGLPGARLAMALDFTTQAGLSYWRFRSGKWRKARV